MKKLSRKQITHDPKTDAINGALLKVPGIGCYLSRIYLWRFCTFNFMLVGATGFFLSWILYEGFFRIMLSGFPFGTLFGMLITTILVFLWNYFWNKTWSLGINSQILIMKQSELQDLEYRVSQLLKEKFDHKGERIS